MANQRIKYRIEIDAETGALSAVEDGFEKVEKAANGAFESLKTGVGIAVGERLVRGLESVPGILFSMAQRGIAFNAQLELGEIKFKTLLGSAEKARARMKELAEFAASTPFQLNGLVQASTVLQTLTSGALATGDGLRLTGDAAATANQPIEEMAVHVGRLYDGLQNGRPVGEAMARLQELGLITSVARAQIELLQKAGKSGDEVWQIAADDLGRYTGQMAELSQAAVGLMSTLADNIDARLGTVMSGAFAEGKEGLTELIKTLNNPETIDRLTEIGVSVANLTEGLIALGDGGFEALGWLQERMDMLGTSVGHLANGDILDMASSFLDLYGAVTPAGYLAGQFAELVSELDGTADTLRATARAATQAEANLAALRAELAAAAAAAEGNGMSLDGLKDHLIELARAADEEAAEALKDLTKQTEAVLKELDKEFRRYGDIEVVQKQRIEEANEAYRARVEILGQWEASAGRQAALQQAEAVRTGIIADAEERIQKARDAANKRTTEQVDSETKLRVQFKADELRAKGQAAAADALERELELRNEIKSVMSATGRSESEAEGFVRRRAALQDSIADQEALAAGKGIRTLTGPGHHDSELLAGQARDAFSRIADGVPTESFAPAGVAAATLQPTASGVGGGGKSPAAVDTSGQIKAVEESGFALVNSFNQLSDTVVSKLNELDRKAAALESRINDSRN